MKGNVRHFIILIFIFCQFSLPLLLSSESIARTQLINNGNSNHLSTSDSSFVLTPVNPSFTIDENDNLYLIYKEYKISYSRIMLMKFNGTSQKWNLTKIPLYTPELDEDINVYPVVKWYNQSLFVIFSLKTAENSKLLLVKINPLTLQLDECFEITSNSNFMTPSMIFNNDFCWLAWQNGTAENYSLYYLKYDLLAENYDSIHLVANSTFGKCFDNNIFVDENSILHIIWSQGELNHHQIHYMSVASNQTILTNMTITSGVHDCIDPAIWVDDSGNVHLFWTNHSVIAPQMMGTINIQTQIFENGSDWSEFQLVAPHLPPDKEGMMVDSQNPSLAQDIYGNLWLGYEEDEPYPYFRGVALRYVTSEGDWQPQESVSTGVSPAYDPQLICDSKGTLHIVWLDFRWNYFEIYYRARRADAYWFTEVQLTSYTIEQVNNNKWWILLAIFGSLILFGIVIPSSFYFGNQLKKKKKNKVIKEYLKNYKIDDY